MNRLRPAFALLSLLSVLCLAPALEAAEVHWGVHLASYRTETTARAGWNELRATHGDLLAPLACQFVPVSIPGKGDYLRLIAGPMEGRAQARELEQALEARGAYAETMPCPENAALARKQSLTPQTATVPAPAAPAVAAVPAPRVTEVTGPTAPSQSLGLRATDSAPEPKAAEQGLRKYVPAPVVDSFKAVLTPLSDREQESREHLPSMPETSASGITGKGHRVGFKTEDSIQDGMTLANAPNTHSRISAQYGNLEKDYETSRRVAPLSPGETGGDFKPYLGLGFHF